MQHIGNPRGRIAIWCDETEANDIAAMFKYPDKFVEEIGRAVELAYPKPVYDYELHSWEPSCPYGDECTGCDAVGRCTKMERKAAPS